MSAMDYAGDVLDAETGASEPERLDTVVNRLVGSLEASLQKGVSVVREAQDAIVEAKSYGR